MIVCWTGRMMEGKVSARYRGSVEGDAGRQVLVRDGETLSSRGFLDTLSDSATILAVFQNPDNGLTTQLAIRSKCAALLLYHSCLFACLALPPVCGVGHARGREAVRWRAPEHAHCTIPVT